MRTTPPQRITRRAALRTAAAAAIALTGCTPIGATAATLVGRRVPLTVFVLGAGGPRSSPTDPFPSLTDLFSRFRSAVERARGAIPYLGPVTVQGDNDPSSWFPLPTSLFDPQEDPKTLVDDPSIPMPDIVIAEHSLIPDYLAIRALDLAPFVKTDTDPLRGVPQAALRLGRAFARERGVFQASLPLLRIPLLCVVGPGVVAVKEGKPWTAEEFLATLTALSSQFTSPNAPMPFVPYSSGVAEMAAVGSGGRLGTEVGAAMRPEWTQAPVEAALAMTVQWAGRAATQPVIHLPVFDYRVAMLDGEQALGEAGFRPSFDTASATVPTKGWTTAPAPVFPARPAIPVRTVDVLVARHTQFPDQAAALALQLLSAESQALFMDRVRRLVLRPDQALKQLGWTKSIQGAELIASPEYDIADEDVWGQPTDAGLAPIRLARQNLMTALGALTGPGGYFYQSDVSTEAAGDVVSGYGSGSVRVVDDRAIRDQLQAAATASAGGRPYTA